MANRNSFLATLPGDALCSLLRFCTPWPKSTYWACHIPLEILELLYELSAGVAGEKFTIVSVGGHEWTCEQCHHPICECFSFDEKHAIRIASKLSLFLPLVENMTHLHLMNSSRLTTFAVQDLVRFAGVLTSLRFDHNNRLPFDLEPFFVARGAQLCTLTMTGSALHLAKHCQNLFELNVTSYLEDLEPVLLNVGANLRVLRLRHGVVTAAKKMEHIRSHCPNLSSIHIEVGHFLFDSLANLLAAYGKQLRYANMNAFNVEQAILVARACPNVAATISIHESRVISVLGIRAQDISLSVNISLSELFPLLMPCTELRKLIFRYDLQEDDHTFYNTKGYTLSPLRNLESLKLRIKKPLKCANFLASRTQELRKLDVEVFLEDFIIPDALRMLAQSNGHLSHVKVFISVRSNQVTSVGKLPLLRKLVYLFSRSPDLKVLILVTRGNRPIKPFGSLRNAVYETMRRRRVHIEIDGLTY